jgi:hypothetical protein
MRYELVLQSALMQAISQQTGGTVTDAQLTEALAVLFGAILTSSIAKSADNQATQTSKLVTLLEANL